MTSDSLRLLSPLCHAVNHLLAQEPWARQKLLAHRGKTAAVDIGVATLRLRVTADGLVETAQKDAVSDVTIRINCATTSNGLPSALKNCKANAEIVDMKVRIKCY